MSDSNLTVPQILRTFHSLITESPYLVFTVGCDIMGYPRPLSRPTVKDVSAYSELKEGLGPIHLATMAVAGATRAFHDFLKFYTYKFYVYEFDSSGWMPEDALTMKFPAYYLIRALCENVMKSDHISRESQVKLMNIFYSYAERVNYGEDCGPEDLLRLHDVLAIICHKDDDVHGWNKDPRENFYGVFQMLEALHSHAPIPPPVILAEPSALTVVSMLLEIYSDVYNTRKHASKMDDEERIIIQRLNTILEQAGDDAEALEHSMISPRVPAALQSVCLAHSSDADWAHTRQICKLWDECWRSEQWWLDSDLQKIFQETRHIAKTSRKMDREWMKAFAGAILTFCKPVWRDAEL